MNQIRRELSTAEATKDESGEMSSSFGSNTKAPRVRRDSHMRIAELITPLAPCLGLINSTDSASGEHSGKLISPSSRAQTMSRLLGPYAAASGDSARALLSSMQQTGRSKKGRGSRRRPPMYTSPFQNAVSWQLTLFGDLQVGLKFLELLPFIVIGQKMHFSSIISTPRSEICAICAHNLITMHKRKLIVRITPEPKTSLSVFQRSANRSLYA